MDIERMKMLIAQREQIDAELVTIVTGNGLTQKSRKPISCSPCGSTEHNSRTCNQGEQPSSTS